MLSILQSYATRLAKKSGATFSTYQRPFVTCSQAVSRVWRPLHVFLFNSDWFVGLSVFSVIGFVFTGAVLVLRTSTQSHCDRCDVTIDMEAMVAWFFYSFKFIRFSSFCKYAVLNCGKLTPLSLIRVSNASFSLRSVVKYFWGENEQNYNYKRVKL